MSVFKVNTQDEHKEVKSDERVRQCYGCKEFMIAGEDDTSGICMQDNELRSALSYCPFLKYRDK